MQIVEPSSCRACSSPITASPSSACGNRAPSLPLPLPRRPHLDAVPRLRRHRADAAPTHRHLRRFPKNCNRSAARTLYGMYEETAGSHRHQGPSAAGSLILLPSWRVGRTTCRRASIDDGGKLKGGFPWLLDLCWRSFWLSRFLRLRRSLRRANSLPASCSVLAMPARMVLAGRCRAGYATLAATTTSIGVVPRPVKSASSNEAGSAVG